MVDLVGEGVLLRVAAAVEGDAVRVLALQFPPTDATADEAFEDVRVVGAVRLVAGAGARPADEHLLDPVERVLFDQRPVGQVLGGDPLVGVVPPHDRCVAERDVVDDLVGPLLVPDLAAGVAGV
jgi:hypothetical protein